MRSRTCPSHDGSISRVELQRMVSIERLTRSDFALLLCLTAFQAVVIAGPFMVNAVYYNDTLGSYGLFYDHLDSLNRFGEPAWWAPHVNLGTPTYFFGLLNIPNLGKPAFVSMGLLAWILGRLGISLPAIYPFYGFYFGVLIPFLFLLGVWLVAREVFRSRAARRYTLAVAAFSPAILLNVSDPGVTENAAYGLICAAAYLRFVARPIPRRFWTLCAAALLVSVAVSSTVVLSAVPMLGLLVLSSVVVSPAARAALRSVPPTHAIAAVALLLVTASPSVIAYVQLRDHVVNWEVGAIEYSFGELKSGNPLQYLLASLPGVPFDWDSYRQDPAGPLSQFQVHSLGHGERFGNYYLGVLALPMAATGLALGRRRIRLALFLMLVSTGGVLALFASSPLLAPVLFAFPVLGTINHFGDELYEGCGFLLLLFAAGLGLEAAERRPAGLRWLTVAFVAVSCFSRPVYLRWGQPAATLGGFAAFIAACFAVILTWAGRLPRHSRSRLLGHGLVALTLLDVATVSFWAIRPALHASSLVMDAGLGSQIGSSDPHANAASEMFALRVTQELKEAGIEVGLLPFTEGFCSALAAGGFEAAREAVLGRDSHHSLGLPEDLRSASSLAPFFSASTERRCEIDIGAPRITYNSIEFSVHAAQPGLVFVRDAWSPGWKASVNGSPSEIYPALGAFKAVAVPAGASEVRFRFSPPWVGIALAGSYAVLAVVAFGAWRLQERVRSIA